MSESNNGIKLSDFKDTPEDWARIWNQELAASNKAARSYLDVGSKVQDIFLAETDLPSGGNNTFVAIFTSNVQTLQAMLYGEMPRVNVKRKDADYKDQVARVACDIAGHLLNNDIERDSDGFTESTKAALGDRLLPGFGLVKMRYVAGFKGTPETPAMTETDPTTGEVREVAPAVPAGTKKAWEDVETDHVHWEDCRWSPCRKWDENRWFAFRNEMTPEDLKKRFWEVFVQRYGEEMAKLKFDLIPLNAEKDDKDGDDPWSRAEVWEIWSREHRKVFFYVEGFEAVLDILDDPLGLPGFYPFPKPLMANLTSKKYMPRADYCIAEDLYKEVNLVSGRITELERAIRVTGVYNGAIDSLKEIIQNTAGNKMYPAAEWRLWQEGGGFKGNVDFLPLDMIVGALTQLREYRTELMGLLYQVTGMSDIMRGESTGGGATATEQAIKAKFASVRLTAFQKEFARFVSDAQRIRLQIITSMYDDATIMARANVANYPPPDQQLAQQALQLLRDELMHFRVEITPESIALSDYAALKQERMEALTAISQYLQGVVQVGQAIPTAIPPLFELLRWSFAGFRGGSQAEAALDALIQSTEQFIQQQMSQPPQPDPQQAAAEVKLETVKEKAQADKAKTAMDMQKAQLDHRINMQESMQRMRESALKAALPSPNQPSQPQGEA